MAETVNIILEFLRQNKFMKAEAALRLELLARQGSTESIFLIPRDLDSLLEPANEEVTPYSDKIFPEDESFCKVAFDSRSKRPSDRLTALDLQLKGWEVESASCNEASRTLGTFAMQQNLMCERSEWDSYGLESTSLPSATFTCGETRPSYGIVGGPRIKDLESGISTHRAGFQRLRGSVNGVVPRGQNNQITEEASGTIGRITGVQNETGEFQIKHENSTPKFIQQDSLETHTQRVDCVVEYITKAGSLCKPCVQASNEKIGMLRWERDCTIDLHGQQETRAYQPEKSTIVYECGDFSVQNVLFPEFLENHCDSFARVSYGDSAENGWFNHCIPSATYSKTSSNGILTDSSQPFSLSCPMIEDSMDQYEQNEKKQVAYDLEGQSRPVDFLKDIAVPWEVAFQNDNVQLGDFEEGKVSTDESRWKGFQMPPHIKIRSVETDLHLLQESNGNFHFDSVLDGGHHGITNAVSEPSFSLGSFLDIPVGQDTPLSGLLP